MKKIYGFILALTAIGLLMSCKQETEEPMKEASVSLKLLSTTTSSVKFELTANDAQTYSYGISADAQTEPEYTTADAVNGEPVEIEILELEKETAYTVFAYATNPEGKKSEVQKLEVRTTSAAQITVAVIEAGADRVKFKVSPVNAVSYGYAVAERTEATSAELTIVENGEEKEYEVTGLKESTAYSIVASAVNASGEESERVYVPFKTEVMPVVTFGEVQAEVFQAKVTVTVSNAKTLHYALAKKGEGEPSEDKFKTVEMNSPATTLLFSELEEQTEYEIYAYAENMNGFRCETVSTSFTTLEYVELPFEIKTSNVLCHDAKISVTFDSELYSKVYFVMGTQIQDPSKWDWKKVIEQGWSYPQYKEYTEDMSFTIREYLKPSPIEPEAVYFAGGIPVKLDGTLDEAAAVWSTIQLKEIEFDQFEGECPIEEIYTNCSAIKFRIGRSNDNVESVYIYNSNANEDLSDPAALKDFVLSRLLPKDPKTNFDMDTVRTSLTPGSEYSLVTVPQDKDGKLGKVTVHKFTTKSLDYEGDAQATVTVAEKEKYSVSFDVALGANTSKVAYAYMKTSDWSYKDETLINIVKTQYKYAVTENGKVTIDNLDPDTEYAFAFAPMDENDVPGKHFIFKEKTASYVYDGDASAKVDIEVTSLEALSFGFGVKLKTTPNASVAKYYVGFKSENNPKFTQSEFTDACVRKGTYEDYEGVADITGKNGDPMRVGSNAVVWVLPVDKDGKLCPIIELKLDKTWN